VISNFGVLNCVARLAAIRESLARAVKPGGYAMLCFLSRFCLWETAWYLLQGEPRKAIRRWPGVATTSGRLRVHYPTSGQIRRDLAPEFALAGRFGIGIAVPPSYVRGLSYKAFARAARLDRRISAAPVFRGIGDHTLYLFQRTG